MTHFMNRPEPQVDTPSLGDIEPTEADLLEMSDHFDHQDEGELYDPFDDPLMGDEDEPQWWEDEDPSGGDYVDPYGPDIEFYEYPE